MAEDAAGGEDMVVIASLGRPFGVHGWVHVRSFTEPPDNALHYQPWRLRRAAGALAGASATPPDWETFAVEARRHAKGLVARIAGYTSREATAAWRGAEVGVDASVLPAAEPGEYYWRDLVGLAAATERGESLGEVARLFATPAHDVLVLADGERERLVPFTKDIVSDVDLSAGRVVLAWQPDWR